MVPTHLKYIHRLKQIETYELTKISLYSDIYIHPISIANVNSCRKILYSLEPLLCNSYILNPS